MLVSFLAIEVLGHDASVIDDSRLDLCSETIEDIGIVKVQSTALLLVIVLVQLKVDFVVQQSHSTEFAQVKVQLDIAQRV